MYFVVGVGKVECAGDGTDIEAVFAVWWAFCLVDCDFSLYELACLHCSWWEFCFTYGAAGAVFFVDVYVHVDPAAFGFG